MYPSQNAQNFSPNLEHPSSQQYNRSPRTPVGDVGSSRILFEDLEDDDEEGAINPSNQPGKSKSKQDKIPWNITEDKALCSAYLEAGGDVEIGTDQKRGDLWVNIMLKFDEAQRENSSVINARNKDSAFSRWRRIGTQVNKWVGVYAEAQRKRKSGWSEDNVMGEAREIWEKTNNGKKFQLEHCWDILKHFPKWQGGMTAEDQQSTHSSKRSNSDTPTIEVRPMGVKRSKRKEGRNMKYCMDNISSTIERPPSEARRKYVRREREQAHEILYGQYFAKHPTYSDETFRRRYRMRRHVFCRIMEALRASDEYFQQKPDGAGRLGLTIEQKCTAAMRMLAYGTAYDSVDEHLNIAESTAKECLLHFVEGVIIQFRNHYMRRPNANDMAELLQEGEERGFPGMMGSIDCMHWTWKNCPRGWRGQFQGRNKTPTLILEAVASRDLWIWHAFFGTPGSCNDINVIDRSPVFTDIMEGQAPPVNFMVNNHAYNMGYYLTDGIYPKWAAFIHSVSAPQTAKQKLFAKKQESARKDVERAFGVLQARFAIIRQPALAWSKDILGKIMLACIIMHNMIVEDERATYKNHRDVIREFEEDRPQNQASSSTQNETFTYSNVRRYNLSSYMSNRSRVRDTTIHKSLKEDLIENIWEKFQEEADD